MVKRNPDLPFDVDCLKAFFNPKEQADINLLLELEEMREAMDSRLAFVDPKRMEVLEQRIIPELKEKIGVSELFVAHDTSLEAKNRPIIDEIIRKSHEVKDFAAAHVDMVELFRLNDIKELKARGKYFLLDAKLGGILEYGEDSVLIRDLIVALERAGLLNDPDPIYIHELLAGCGLTTIFTAMARKNVGRTAGLCLELYGEDEKAFYEAKKLFGLGNCPLLFKNQDIAKAEMKNHPTMKNIWIAHEADNFIPYIIDKAVSRDGENVPDKVLIFPCHEHSYIPENYPARGDTEIFPINLWEEICPLTQQKSSASRSLIEEARRLIDCFWVYTINQQSDYLEAKVYQLPNRYLNMIIAQVGYEEED